MEIGQQVPNTLSGDYIIGSTHSSGERYTELGVVREIVTWHPYDNKDMGTITNGTYDYIHMVQQR